MIYQTCYILFIVRLAMMVVMVKYKNLEETTDIIKKLIINVNKNEIQF